jgi:hypothetical protein
MVGQPAALRTRFNPQRIAAPADDQRERAEDEDVKDHQQEARLEVTDLMGDVLPTLEKLACGSRDFEVPTPSETLNRNGCGICLL